MKTEPANWMSLLISLVPLAQSLAWVGFGWLLVSHFGKELKEMISSLAVLVSKGDHLKVGPVELGLSAERLAELRKLPAVPPPTETAAPVAIAPEIVGNLPKNPMTLEEWTAYREGIYRGAKGFFLAHTLIPSNVKGQTYDVFITVNKYASRRFASISISDIEFAEFFLGRHWGNRIFCEKPSNDLLGIQTSAYGGFLCVCKLTLRSKEIIMLSRDIDFHMGVSQGGNRTLRGEQRKS
jgi:hypothetical protein